MSVAMGAAAPPAASWFAQRWRLVGAEMNRRIVVLVLAALGLVVVPLPAAAYDAPPYTTTVSDSTPTAGTPFTVTSSGIVCSEHAQALTPCPQVTLTITSASASVSDDAITIAGTKSLTKAARFDYPSWKGTVTWTVALSEPGTYTLTVVRAWRARELMSEMTVVVGASDDGGQSGDGGRLSDTGFDVLLVSGVAGGLVVAGVVAVWLARRRVVGRSGR